MKIQEAIFYKSVFIDDNTIFLDNKKEIVFVGRSNVWKSSIMNALMWKKDLVKTSSVAWKTKTANLFIVNNKYYYTDLPWYWFAKLWKELKDKLDGLISWYIEERANNIKKIVMLIDSKIWPQQTDIDMYKYLLELWVSVVVVLAKVDKLSKNEILKSKLYTENEFFWVDVFPVSSKKNIWVKELSRYLRQALEEKKI